MGNKVIYSVDNIEYLIKNMDKYDGDCTILANMIIKMPNEFKQIFPQTSVKSLMKGGKYDCLLTACKNNNTEIALLIMTKLPLNYFYNQYSDGRYVLIGYMIDNNMDDALSEFCKFHRITYRDDVDKIIQRRMIKTIFTHFEMFTSYGAIKCLRNNIPIKFENILYNLENSAELFREAYDHNRDDIAMAIMLKYDRKIMREFPNECKVLEKSIKQLPKYENLS